MANIMRWGKSTKVSICKALEATIGQCRIPETPLACNLTEDSESSIIVALDGYLIDVIPLIKLLPKGDYANFSQSELILKAYLFHGKDCFSVLKGQFGIALWNGKERALNLVTDKAGSRNIYYMKHKNSLLFSTQMKSLLAVPGLSLELDDLGIAELFSFGYVIGDLTFFKHLRLVMPGTILTYCEGKLSREIYWTPNITEEGSTSSIKACMEELHNKMEIAHRRCTYYIKKVGIGLSGGRDSRLSAAYFARQPDVDVIAYSFDVGRKGEAHIAKIVAGVLGIPYNEVIVKDLHYEKLHRTCSWLSEGGINTCEFLRLAMEAQPEVDGLAWGFLGDILSGHTTSPLIYKAKTREDVSSIELRVEMDSMIPENEHKRAFNPDLFQRVRGEVHEHWVDTFNEIECDLPLNIFMIHNLRQRQRRRTLRVMDITDSFIPNLFPYLDDDVMEFMLAMPEPYRKYQRCYDRVLNHYYPKLAKIRSPGYNISIRNQIPLMPYIQMIKRAKCYIKKYMYWSTPPRLTSIDTMYSRVLRGKMYAYTRSCLVSLSDYRALLSKSYVMDMLERHRSENHNAYYTLLKLVTLETFLRQMLDGSEQPELEL